MEFTQLRALVTIVKEGSFTRAAEKLFVTQPALSLQIKALEREMGEELLERQGRRLLLTAPGRLVLAHAETILAQVEQLQRELAALQGVAAGHLCIGTSDTICLYLLPPVIQRFRLRYPEVRIQLRNRPSAEVVAQLLEGEIDFGIVTLPVVDPRLEAEYLCDREEVAICHPTHPLAQQQTATLAELTQAPLLLLDKGATSRQLLDQQLLQVGLRPEIIELGSIEVIKRYAAIDLGVAVVPRMAVTMEVATETLHPLTIPWLPKRAIGVVRRRNGYRSPAERVFLQLLQEIVDREARPL
ncbi:MAG: LysR family transcriptional regulator [Caldilineaceae bacterium]